MPELILHHYPMSPFSQKMRSMLGYTGLPWQSVIHKESPPRPALSLLAGGYRKIPVAQDGADVFCDTRVIAEEIALRAGLPTLALAQCSAEAQAWAARADQEMFFSCVLAAGNGRLGRKAWEAMSVPELLRFAWDRMQLGRTARVAVVNPLQARPAVRGYAAELERQLSQDFLCGEQPCHADFSGYHGLWMIRELAESPQLDGFPRLMAWMDRIKGMGEGSPSLLSAESALAQARQATPRAVPAEQRQDAQIGLAVTVAPADYGQVPTRGVLVGATPTRWILARESRELGTVHVHFPRQGYTLRPA